MFFDIPGPQNRNVGTFAKTALLQNRPFVSSRCVVLVAVVVVEVCVAFVLSPCSGVILRCFLASASCFCAVYVSNAEKVRIDSWGFFLAVHAIINSQRNPVRPLRLHGCDLEGSIQSDIHFWARYLLTIYAADDAI